MKAKLWGKWGIGILALGIVAAGVFYVREGVSRALAGVLQPVVGYADELGQRIAVIGTIVLQSPRRAEEVRALRIENAMLNARITELEDIGRENRELKNMLGRETQTVQFIFARIAAVSPYLLDGYVVLDAGIEEGVEVGMPVLAGESVLIGAIVQVTSHSSSVRLLSHAGEKVEVYIPTAEVSSVAQGKGAGALEIQVPASIAVRQGDPVLAVGPQDFLIGYVEKVEKSDAGPFQVLRTSHPVSITDLRRVYIVK